MNSASRRTALDRLGTEVSLPMIAATQDLARAALDPGLGDGVTVVRDLAYGPHSRHRLDVFHPATGSGEGRPVLVFVHGGGFVAGAKSTPGSPFYDNVGNWAVRHGMVGVTINYRLAPENTWPGGAADIAGAIEWVAATTTEYGGDPAAVFLAGQSAGAMHVADYISRPELHAAHGRGLAGGLLFSCLFDIGSAGDKEIHRAYYGPDLSAWAQASTQDGLIATDLPMFVAISEFDDPGFQQQAAGFAAEYATRTGSYPPLHYLYGHNHLSPVLLLGSHDDDLGPLIERFVATAG